MNWSRSGQEMEWHENGEKNERQLRARYLCNKQIIPQIAKTEAITVSIPCGLKVPVNPTSNPLVSHTTRCICHGTWKHVVILTTLMTYRWIKPLLFLDWESYARRFN